MNIMVLGAGAMGRAAAFDLVRNRNIERVVVVDRERKKLHQTKVLLAQVDETKTVYHQFDALSDGRLVQEMKRTDAVISALPYFLNFQLAKYALSARTNFCDLGGNTDMVHAELKLHSAAKRSGITIIPDCGLAPGITNVLAAEGAKQLDKIEKIELRVGGIPQKREPHEYQLTFSVHGLINEYAGKARIIRNGKCVEVPSMTGIEKIKFAGFETLEAAHTSGGTSTLVDTFLGRVRELNYKTIRYSGHWEKYRFLFELGLADTQPYRIKNVNIRPRELLAELLTRYLSHNEKDAVLLRVTISGRKGGKKKSVVYEMIDFFDEHTGLTAMMRTTAFMATSVAEMLANGDIWMKGAYPPELCVPGQRLIEALAKKGIKIVCT